MPIIFGNRVRALRRAAKLTQAAFAKAVGLSGQTAVTRLERGSLESITFTALSAIIGFAIREGRMSPSELLLGLSPLSWATDEQVMEELTRRVGARVLGGMGLTMDAPGDQRVVDVADIRQWGGLKAFVREVLTDRAAEQMTAGASGGARARKPSMRPGFHTVPPEDVPTSHDWHKHFVPVLGKIAAGEGIDTIEAAEYPPAWAGEFLVYAGAPPTSVAVRVIGGSMEPTYANGDMVIVDPAQPAASGEIACVQLARDDGSQVARLKRFRLTPKYATLESTHPDHKPERIRREKVVAAYRIVRHLPRLVED